MADNIVVDDSQMQKGLEELLKTVGANALKAVNDIATEVLRLSQKEVPIHTVEGEPGGGLQNSGNIQQAKDPNNIDAIVGYNKIYAAYQHEGMRKDGSHVVKQYTNSRSKRKFLEDPIRKNTNTFIEYYKKVMNKG